MQYRDIERKSRIRGELVRKRIKLPEISITERLKEKINGNASSKAAMSAKDIESLLGVIPSYIGQYWSDEIALLSPPSMPMRFCLIMNLSKSTEMGTHWVAIVVDPTYEHEINYYDPLGNPPSESTQKDLANLMSKMENEYELKFKYNTVPTQDTRTWRCGWHCCLFLMNRFLIGMTFKEATKFTEDDAHRYQLAVFRTFDQPDHPVLRLSDREPEN